MSRVELIHNWRESACSSVGRVLAIKARGPRFEPQTGCMFFSPCDSCADPEQTYKQTLSDVSVADDIYRSNLQASMATYVAGLTYTQLERVYESCPVKAQLVEYLP